MKSNITKLIIIGLGIFALGFFIGFMVDHYFFKTSKPVQINEERKRIQALPDSALEHEFNAKYRSKDSSR